MAFQKAITNPKSGVTAIYWRVGNVMIDAVSAIAKIRLFGYVSPQIRALPDGTHIDERMFVISGPEFVALVTTPNGGATPFDAVARAAYHHIKTAQRTIPGEPFPWISEFVDAEDI